MELFDPGGFAALAAWLLLPMAAFAVLKCLIDRPSRPAPGRPARRRSAGAIAPAGPDSRRDLAA